MRSLAVLLLSFLAGCAASPPPEQAAEPPGLDRAVLAGLGAHMEQRVAAGRMIGAFGLIEKDGEVVFFETWGKRDRESDLPMTKDTVVRMFSMTKPITSVGVLSLVEEGKLALTDPVSKHLPELGALDVLSDGERVPSTREVTIQDLLTHTSGLTYGFFADHRVDALYREAQTHRAPDLAALMGLLAKLPLKFQPGERWNYGYSTDVLGRVIEVVSGRALDQFFEQRIFGPLGMTETGFHVRAGSVERLARIYTPNEQDELVHATDEIVAAAGRRVRDFTRPTTFLSGGGGLVSTPGDYLKFARIFLNGGGGVVSSQSIERMLRNHLPEGEERMFGLGMGIDDAPVGRSRIYGWGGAAGTRFWVDPERGMITMVGQQLYPGGDKRKSELRAGFLEAAYEAAGD